MNLASARARFGADMVQGHVVAHVDRAYWWLMVWQRYRLAGRWASTDGAASSALDLAWHE